MDQNNGVAAQQAATIGKATQDEEKEKQQQVGLGSTFNSLNLHIEAL